MCVIVDIVPVSTEQPLGVDLGPTLQFEGHLGKKKERAH
jgi:hypothetical protein